MGIVTNPKIRIVAINASNGSVVLISASKFCRYVEISECAPGGGSFTGGNFSPQGINYFLPDDNYVTEYPLLPGATLPLGDNTWDRNKGFGVPQFTDPANQTIGPTPFVKMISAASATQVQVKEWS